MPTDPTDLPSSGPTADLGVGTAVVTDAPDPTSDEPGVLGEDGSKGGGYRWVIEWAVILMAVLLCTVLLRTYVVQSFYIPSPSMVPTLNVGDRIMVNKLSYDLHGVHRGDIVVFKRPPLEQQDFPDLVKRVIGLPGESVSTQNGHVYINGKLLPEPWLAAGSSSYTGALPGDQHPQFNMPGPVKVPAGEYFVMGDNRTDSEDSRFFGPIQKSLIVGRAVAVVWPLSQAKGV
ncbi:MAG TPA: signal peptidase I [Acidimicrobiales bacterium]